MCDSMGEYKKGYRSQETEYFIDGVTIRLDLEISKQFIFLRPISSLNLIFDEDEDNEFLPHSQVQNYSYNCKRAKHNLAMLAAKMYGYFSLKKLGHKAKALCLTKDSSVVGFFSSKMAQDFYNSFCKWFPE